MTDNYIFRFYFDDPEPEPEPESTVEENTNVSTDFVPAISIDHVNRLKEGFQTLAKALGITRMTPMPAGTIVKRYKKSVTTPQNQVAEGEVIPLSKVAQTALTDLVLTLKKFRRLTTAEAIQTVGADLAINQSDEALIGEVRKGIRDDFFTMVKAAGTAITGGANLQVTLAAVWAGLQSAFEDIDCHPVYFINPADVATYLGTASITTQDAFGFNYVENFLGLGTAFITPQVTAGTVFATAAENLNGVYVPQGGDIANLFGLTYDESGMAGMTHTLAGDRASIQTLILTGVLFYPEDNSKVLKSTIVSG